MCTVFVIRDRLPDAPLVLAANRDEMNDRPWHGPRWTGEALAPVDLQAGGTWIGMHRTGWGVALTNRMLFAPREGRRSRGLLVSDVLRASSLEVARGMLSEAVRATPYNAFNAVLAGADEAWVLTVDDRGQCWTAIDDDVHVITSRHDLDHPDSDSDRARIRRLTDGATLAEALPHLCAALAEHAVRPDGYAICKHGRFYGTQSAAIVALGPRDAGRFWFASGPPCRHDFELIGTVPARG